MNYQRLSATHPLLLMALLWSFLQPVAAQEKVTQLFHWSDPTMTGSFWYNNAYNEVWGVAQNGREYAIIGSSRGTHFFDITDPGNAYEAAFVLGADTGNIIIHRDFHDYQGYLYAVSDEGHSSLQIIDLQYLPDSVVVVYDDTLALVRAHNIFIDSTAGTLYACGVSHSDGTGQWHSGMDVFSLADPTNPQHLYAYNDVWATHDVFVRNSIAYMNNGDEGLLIMDFSDPQNPVELGSLDVYPDQGYNHSGWTTDDGKFYAFADENHGLDLKICNVQDPTDIQVVSTIGTEAHDSSMAHNLIIKGDYMYVSYYHEGLQVFNIEDPAHPVRVGSFGTYLEDNHTSYRGAWGVYPLLPSGVVLISDMQRGLFVLDVTDALAMPVANFEAETQNGYDIQFHDHSANGVTSWQWDLGDGSTINTTQDPQHQYSIGTYEVCLIVSNAAGSDTACQTLTITTDSTETGIVPTSGEIGDWTIFPNPVKDRLQLLASNQQQTAIEKIELLDMRGALIKAIIPTQQAGNRIEITTAHLPTGMYFVAIQTVKGRGVQKFIKSN